MSERIFIAEARISYPHLHQARKINEADPNEKAKFSASLVITSDHPAVAQIQAAIPKVVQEGGLDPNRMKPIPWVAGGDDFPGCIIIRANATTKPHVVDENVQPVIDPGKVYAGCFVNASISVYTYKRATGSGVAFGLDGIQFLRDGDRLDGRPTADQMFQKVQGAPPAAPGAPVPGVGAPAVGVPGTATTAPAVDPTAVPGAPGTSAGPASSSWNS